MSSSINLLDSLASLNSDDYHHYVRHIAGGLYGEVNVIFPQDLKIAYLVASFRRRATWHCYLAMTYGDPDNPRKVTYAEEVRKKLLCRSADALLSEAFGTLPEGFVKAVERLPQSAQSYRLYGLLHSQMTHSKDVRKAYAHTASLNPKTIEKLNMLPAKLKSVALAEMISDTRDIETLAFIVDMLGRNGDDSICAAIVENANQGKPITGLLRRAYNATAFPKQLVPNSDHCRYISNGFELRKLAHRFNNCLADYIPESIRGEIQVYEWLIDSRPACVVSIRFDHPFGARITEIKGKKNEYIDDDVEQDIVAYFKQFDVHHKPLMEFMLRQIEGMLSRRRSHDTAENDMDRMFEEWGIA